MVSVCMATFNGHRFIKEQIISILSQLEINDELIISDDGSEDSTIDIIESFNDSRIVLYKNSFRNVVKNFEFAIGKSSGDFIFLSDQDDIWHREKISTYLKCFDVSKADLIISNVEMIDSDGQIITGEFFPKGFNKEPYSNIVKNKFIGCAMAFRQNTKKWFLPFPDQLPMHDWWIGLVTGKKGKITYIEEKLLYYRRHGGNATTGRKSSIGNIIKWRWLIIKNLFLNV